MALKLVKSGTIFNIVPKEEVKHDLEIISRSKAMTDCIGIVKFMAIARLKNAGYTDKELIKILKKAHHPDKEIIEFIHDANFYNNVKKDGKP